MTTHGVGADLLEFLSSWPEGAWWDDTAEWVASSWSVEKNRYDLDPAKEYLLDDFGTIYEYDGPMREIPFSDAFLQWLEKQKFATVVVRVPKEKTGAFKNHLTQVLPQFKGTLLEQT